jgi:hypothetical protein
MGLQEIESGLDSILAIIRLIGSKGELVTYLQGGEVDAPC